MACRAVARQSEGWSQSRVLPSAELACETPLSAGPIAKWSPHPELHRVGSRTERAHHWKCFGGFENGRRETTCARLRSVLWRGSRPTLPDSESGGSAIPREPRTDEIGVPDRLRSGLRAEASAGKPVISCMRGRHVGLDYTTGTKRVRTGGFAPPT